MNRNDIYSHLMKGGDPQVLLDAFLADLNNAQQEVDMQKKLEQKRKEEEAAKKAVAKENKEKKENARKSAIAALKDYFTLVNPKVEAKDLDEYAKLTVDYMGATISKLDTIITKDGNHVKIDLGSLFDLFF